MKLKELTRDQILKWQDERLSDEEMARKCNTSKATFRRYRLSLGIETKRNALGRSDKIIFRIPVSEFILRKLYFEDKLSFKQMVPVLQEMDIGITSSSTIHHWFKKYGITAYLNKNERYSEKNITKKQWNIIYGSLLGNSTCKKDKVYFTCKKEEDYLIYKNEILKNISVKIYNKGFSTRHLKVFEPIVNKFYENSNKIIPLDIKEWFNWEVLAIWFGDNGYTDNLERIVLKCKYDSDSINRINNVLIEKKLEFELLDESIIFSLESSKLIKKRCLLFLPENIRYKFNYIEPVNENKERKVKEYLHSYPQITYDLLYEYHIVQKLSDQKIANKLLVKRAAINYLRSYYKISKKNKWIVGGKEWRGLAPKLKEKALNDTMEYYRENSPFKLISKEDLLKKWEDLKIYETIETQEYVSGDTRFNSMCFHFHPYIFNIKNKGVKLSPQEMYENDELFKEVLKEQLTYFEGVKPGNIRSALRHSSKSYAVSMFRPSVAKNLYSWYTKAGDAVLDPCAGYGGRLLGAAALDLRYTGIDPSPNAIYGNREMIKELNLKNIGVVKERAELFMPSYPPEIFDFIFTSPPYFDTELYDESEEQSYKCFPSWDAWKNGFLKFLVVESYRVLKIGKHFALNVSDNRYPMTEALMEISKEVGFKFVTTHKMPMNNLFKKDNFESIHVFVK